MKKFRNSPAISTTARPVNSTTAGRRNLIRSKRGFTLTEMLISVMLLGIVSVMVTVMTSAVLSSTSMMQEIAQAEILGNAVLENVQGQLRIAQKIKVEKDTGQVNFDIDDANTDYTFDLKDGQIVLITKKSEKEQQEIFFRGVSYGNLSVGELQFTEDSKKGAIGVSVSIALGEKILWTGSITVKPLNGLTVT